MAKQGLAERGAANEVLVLFPHNFRSALEFLDPLQHLWGEGSWLQVVCTSFSEKLQTMPPGVSHEFMEVERLVDFAQVVMEKGFVEVFEGPLILTSDGGHVVIWLRCGFCQELQKPARLPHLLDRILEACRMKTHHPSDEIAQMVSRVR